jgi:hypothetical protein
VEKTTTGKNDGKKTTDDPASARFLAAKKPIFGKTLI